ncbi:hypothetical protein D3C81_1233570 [compost metagenome]
MAQHPGQQRAAHAEHGARRPDRHRRLRPEMQAQGAAHQPRAEIDQQEAARAVEPLHMLAEHEQHQHVGADVLEAAVQEGGRQQSPPLTLLDQHGEIAAPFDQPGGRRGIERGAVREREQPDRHVEGDQRVEAPGVWQRLHLGPEGLLGSQRVVDRDAGRTHVMGDQCLGKLLVCLAHQRQPDLERCRGPSPGARHGLGKDLDHGTAAQVAHRHGGNLGPAQVRATAREGRGADAAGIHRQQRLAQRRVPAPGPFEQDQQAEEAGAEDDRAGLAAREEQEQRPQPAEAEPEQRAHEQRGPESAHMERAAAARADGRRAHELRCLHDSSRQDDVIASSRWPRCGRATARVTRRYAVVHREASPPSGGLRP